MDLLGGIRITKRSTGRWGQKKSDPGQNHCHYSKACDVPNLLLPMSGSEKSDLHVIISLLERPRSAAFSTKTGECLMELEVNNYITNIMKNHDQFLEGMLLRNMDIERRFPFIFYSVYNTAREGQFVADSRWEESVRHGLAFSSFNQHTGYYDEMYTFIDPSLPFLPKKPTNPNVGFIVTVFRSIGNQETLEQSWASWSGANFITAHAPRELALQRLSLYRLHMRKENPETEGGGVSALELGFTYVLVCELGEVMAHVCRAREFVDKIRTRECGYTSLYVIDSTF